MPTTYVNSINSNPIYATLAEKDASGNVITTTYATKSEIPSDELPAKTASDAGKALVVNSAGTGVEWSSVGGGSTYTFTDGIQEVGGAVSLNRSELVNMLYEGGTAGLTINSEGSLEVACDNETIVLSNPDGMETAVLSVMNPMPEAPTGASDAGKVLTIATDGEGNYAPAWAALSIPTIGTVSI